MSIIKNIFILQRIVSANKIAGNPYFWKPGYLLLSLCTDTLIIILDLFSAEQHFCHITDRRLILQLSYKPEIINK